MVLDRNGSTCFQSGLKSIDILLVNVSTKKLTAQTFAKRRLYLRKGDDLELFALV